MENNIEEAIKVMEHWIEYEKNNKEKINRADELINIQETILSAYKRVLKENKELKTITNQYEAYECEAPKDSRAKIIIADKLYFNNGYFKNNFIEIDKIKKVFEDLEKIIKVGEENV